MIKPQRLEQPKTTPIRVDFSPELLARLDAECERLVRPDDNQPSDRSYVILAYLEDTLPLRPKRKRTPKPAQNQEQTASQADQNDQEKRPKLAKATNS